MQDRGSRVTVRSPSLSGSLWAAGQELIWWLILCVLCKLIKYLGESKAWWMEAVRQSVSQSLGSRTGSCLASSWTVLSAGNNCNIGIVMNCTQ